MAGFKGGFGGFGGGAQMQQLMKQAQKMQEDMEKAQAELSETVVEGTAGGGMVKVTMNCKKENVAFKLTKEAVDPDDVEMLEDLLTAAFLDASKKADEISGEKMGAFGSLGGLM